MSTCTLWLNWTLLFEGYSKRWKPNPPPWLLSPLRLNRPSVSPRMFLVEVVCLLLEALGSFSVLSVVSPESSFLRVKSISGSTLYGGGWLYCPMYDSFIVSYLEEKYLLMLYIRYITWKNRKNEYLQRNGKILGYVVIFWRFYLQSTHRDFLLKHIVCESSMRWVLIHGSTSQIRYPFRAIRIWKQRMSFVPHDGNKGKHHNDKYSK